MKDIQHKRVLSHLWIMWAAVLAIFLFSFAGSQQVQAAVAGTTANNVILFIGDGMGPEHVKAGGMYTNGAAGTLVFESFPNKTTMTHLNASGATTDSAASATAMATGVKVNNGVISVATPGDGSELTTQLEIYKALDKNTGLVSTSYITDASPAAFGAHEGSRSNRDEIFDDYITQTMPTLFLGGGGNGFDVTDAQGQGYEVVSTRDALLGVFTESAVTIAGGFGSGEIPADGMSGRSATLPTLPEMTETALNILDNDPDGFFLVVEHEGSDNYSHGGNTEGMVRSVKELNAAVQAAVDWMADNPDTLILVTADHETGGLIVTEDDPVAGEVPAVTWTTGGHTNTAVPVFAKGVGAAQVVNGVQIDNTDIFTILGAAAAGETPHNLVDWIWSGAVTSSSAVVNAKVKSSADVTLLLSEYNDLSSPTTIGPLAANSGNNNTVSFDLSSLTADRRYHYAIQIGGQVDGQHRGTFRTFPAGAFSFAFAISGDAEQGSNLPVFDVVREEQTRFFVSPGDFMYSDIGVDNVNLYRSAFAETLSASRQSELYRNMPIAYMWDDHDYATNNSDKYADSRSSAREAYQEIVPHYPLGAVSAVALDRPDVAAFDNVPIYQSFTVGRAYFILTDLRSERDSGAGTMMGAVQKQWFKDELEFARENLYTPIFWLSSVPWIAAADSGADHWAGFHAERVEIANFIKANDIQNVIILSADAHMIALDDGTNSDYATDGGAPLPVFQAAALDRGGSIKGGPYSHGAYQNDATYISQYALVQVTDNGGDDVDVRYVGKRLTAADTVRVLMSPNAVEAQVPLDWSTTLTVPQPTAVTLHNFSAAAESTAVAPVGFMVMAVFGLTLGMLQIISIRRTARKEVI